ncbi:hypothetical protein LPB138_07305 [Urechidicola croceus]|uniref:DUF3324 domain-containing protein n=2 Tax=Urechidicola croceus TaxID=1850246 RepID=A0A1D8P7F8_9FLAO|nr:hypothetical protein LPB138_07305 [Urechidicola croceus]
MYANVAITNGLTHIYKGNSGDVISGEVILMNGSDQEQLVTFELNEAIFSCETNRIFTNEYSHPKSSTDWFNGKVLNKVLGPKEKYVYTYTIEMPNDKSLRGSYWTVLKVNLEKPIREESINGNIGLDTKITYAVALLTHVNDYDELSLDFENINLKEDAQNLKKELEVKLINNSLFIEGIKLSLEIYDNNGVKVHEGKTDRNLTFPGFCRDFLIDVSSLPNGKYECVLIADSREEFIGTNISLTID